MSHFPVPGTSPPSIVQLDLSFWRRGGYGDTRKERVRLLLDEPSSSRMALALAIFLAFAIICSSILAVVETVPIFYRSNLSLLLVIESLLVAIFTLEFATRCYAHSSTWGQLGRFLRSFFTLIDLLAIVPFYVSILWPGNEVSEMQKLTVLRLFRLLRLFRCYTFSSLLQLSIDALVMSMRKSTDALLALLVFLSFIMVTFSTLMYFAERGVWDPVARLFRDADGQPSQFSSIPAAFWFVAEVITTVGLGDVHPKTLIGKAIAIPLMMFSLLIIALPSIVIGRNFAESWAWLRSTRPARPSMSIVPMGGGGGGPTTSPSSPHLSDQALLNGPTNSLHVTMSRAPSAPTVTPPLGGAREGHFLAELSSTQLATQLAHDLEHHPLPAPSASIGEHGEVVLGILQELQRQNELLERLISAQCHLQHYAQGLEASSGTSPVPHESS